MESTLEQSSKVINESDENIRGKMSTNPQVGTNYNNLFQSKTNNDKDIFSKRDSLKNLMYK